MRNSKSSGQKSPKLTKLAHKRKIARLKRVTEKTVAKMADGAATHVEENLVEKIHKIRDIRLHILEWCLMLVAIIVLALLQSVWFQDSYSAATFVSGGSFVEGDLGEIDTLNPLFADTSSEKSIAKLLFSSLTTADYSGNAGLGLAASVSADLTGKVWTVKLRDGLKWSDGEPLTRSDVIFTVGLVQNPRLSTPYSSNLSGVTVAEGATDNEIIFTLSTAFIDFSSALNFPILPEHILRGVDPSKLLESDFSSAPTTSGPFKYNATQISPSGETVVYLSANPHYHGGRPLLDSFAVHAFSDIKAIESALSSGSITATAELSPATQASFSGVYEKQTTISSGVFLFFNTTSSVFKSKPARQAVRQGIDLTDIRSVLGDEPSLNYPILKSQVDITDWPALPLYDQAAARSYFGDNDQTISLVTIDSGYFPKLADKIKYALENLGFTVDLTTYSVDQIATVISSRNYDLLLYEIELGADPDLFAYYHSSQTGTSGLNLSNYNDAITDDLILAARSSTSQSTRDEKYSAFLTRWVENCPAIGIYQVNLAYFLNSNVRAFSEDSTLVSPVDRFADVEYWSAMKATKYRTP